MIDCLTFHEEAGKESSGLRFRDSCSRHQVSPSISTSYWRRRIWLLMLRMMWIKLLMRMHLLKTEVEAVCALGWHFDQGEILFQQILLCPLVRYTTEILHVSFVHCTVLIGALTTVLMLFHNHTQHYALQPGRNVLNQTPLAQERRPSVT